MMMYFGWRWKTRPPAYQSRSGYRSKRARRSPAAWDRAQQITARVWRIAGAVLAPGFVLCKLLFGQSYYVSQLLYIVSIIGLCMPRPFVESHLKQEFGD